MPARYAVLGGTALREVDGHVLVVETPGGPVEVTYAEPDGLDGAEVLFADRHASPEGRVTAHAVSHERNLRALDRAGAEALVGVHSVGALDPGLDVGALRVPEGLVDATGRPPAVHGDEPVHVAVDPPFCPRVREALLHGDEVDACGAYVGTRGPRLETPSEVELLAQAGDVVGMTAAGEAAAARELGLCYASLSVVVNAAAGLGGELAAGDLAAAARRTGGGARDAASAALDRHQAGSCSCPEAPQAGRLHR